MTYEISTIEELVWSSFIYMYILTSESSDYGLDLSMPRQIEWWVNKGRIYPAVLTNGSAPTSLL